MRDIEAFGIENIVHDFAYRPEYALAIFSHLLCIQWPEYPGFCGYNWEKDSLVPIRGYNHRSKTLSSPAEVNYSSSIWSQGPEEVLAHGGGRYKPPPSLVWVEIT